MPGRDHHNYLLPLLLLALLVVAAMVNVPLTWLSRWGSWLMVAAAFGLAWALLRRRQE
ncbi:MAG: hypothetical protein NVS2B7_09990 [Herpetosiphon sp.]